MRAPLSYIRGLGIINFHCCLSLRALLSSIKELVIINSNCCLSFRASLSFMRELGIINSYCCLSFRVPLNSIRELGIINYYCCLSFRALLSSIRELGIINSNCFNPIQDWAFWGCSRMWGAKRSPLPKICHTCPTMMKRDKFVPYLKKIQKYIRHVTHIASSADISIFSPEISNFCYINKHMYRLYFDT